MVYEGKINDLKTVMKQKENRSYFLETLGDTSQLRVMDFLIGNFFFDFPITEIARGANVSYNSLKVFFEDFIKKGVIIKTRKIGKSDYFKINTENPFVENLMKLDWILTKAGVLSDEIQTTNLQRSGINLPSSQIA